MPPPPSTRTSLCTRRGHHVRVVLVLCWHPSGAIARLTSCRRGVLLLACLDVDVRSRQGASDLACGCPVRTQDRRLQRYGSYGHRPHVGGAKSVVQVAVRARYTFLLLEARVIATIAVRDGRAFDLLPLLPGGALLPPTLQPRRLAHFFLAQAEFGCGCLPYQHAGTRTPSSRRGCAGGCVGVTRSRLWAASALRQSRTDTISPPRLVVGTATQGIEWHPATLPLLLPPLILHCRDPSPTATTTDSTL